MSGFEVWDEPEAVRYAYCCQRFAWGPYLRRPKYYEAMARRDLSEALTGYGHVPELDSLRWERVADMDAIEFMMFGRIIEQPNTTTPSV